MTLAGEAKRGCPPTPKTPSPSTRSQVEEEGKHLGSDEDAKGSLFREASGADAGDLLDGSAAAAASGERTMRAEVSLPETLQ